MTNAFSVLSLKRYRSPSISRTNSREEESVHKKLSRLKLLRFYVLSKFTNPINSERSNQNNNFFLQPFFGSTTNQRQQQKDEDRELREPFKDVPSYVNSLKQHQQQDEEHYPFNNINVERNLYSAPLIASSNKKKKLKSILINRSHHHKKSTSSTTTTAAASYLSDPSNQYYSSHISISNITINSEDLTAKEFASLAGIRILSEDEEEETERRISGDDDNDDDDTTSILHTISSSFDQHNMGNSVISRISRESSSRPRIWDNEFWTKPNNKPSKPIKKEDLPILNEFRRMGTCSSEKSSVIRKGRFEIYLEN